MAKGALHQLVHARSAYAQTLQALLRENGYDSRLYLVDDLTADRSSGGAQTSITGPLLYHHTKAPAPLGVLRAHADRVAVVHYGASPDTAALAGFESFAVSRFAAEAIPQSAALPPLLDPLLLEATPSERDLEGFVYNGEHSPSQRLEDLLLFAEAYGERFGHAHLHLLGAFDREDPYARYLWRLAKRLAHVSVRWHGEVSRRDVAAFYSRASLFVSMAERVPAVNEWREAMTFGLPVFAFAAGAAEEVAGAELFHAKNYAALARAAHALIAAGRRPRESYDRPAAERRTLELIERRAPKPTKARSPRLTVVVGRYGEDVNGGAEYLARLLCEQLAPHVDLEVLTTRALDYRTWQNHYPAGAFELNGVRGQRFSVDLPRDLERFDLVSHAPVRPRDEDWVNEQGPVSTALLRAIAERKDESVFLFVTYLYWPTVMGLGLVGDRAILLPTAHDEPPIHFPIYRGVFSAPKALAYLTEEEKETVTRIFGTVPPGRVLGVGLARAPRFGRRAGRYFAYAGRVEVNKGCYDLFDAYRAYRESTKDPADLVLVGREAMEIPKIDGLERLGFVSEAEKYGVLAGALAVITPSYYESLCFTLLEALSVQTPVLANGRCDVLRGHIERSKAGLAYFSTSELAAQLRTLAEDDAQRSALGSHGPAYVAEHYDWPRVKERYLAFFAEHFPAVLNGPPSKEPTHARAG